MARPTKYDPAFCERVIELSKDGASLLECAHEIGVVKQTLLNWAEEHDEFLDALTRAKAARQIWWERVHRSCALTGQGNAASIQFGLKNIAPEEWAEKFDLNHGGQADNPVVHRIERKIVRPDNRDR